MAKKSDYSLFSNFFFNSLKKLEYSLIFRSSFFTIHYFWAHYSLFIIKKGHYSLIIIPHLDPHIVKIQMKCHKQRHLIRVCTVAKTKKRSSEKRIQFYEETIIWASSQENPSSGFLTKRVSNQSPQLQRLARKLKFHL